MWLTIRSEQKRPGRSRVIFVGEASVCCKKQGCFAKARKPAVSGLVPLSAGFYCSRWKSPLFKGIPHKYRRLAENRLCFLMLFAIVIYYFSLNSIDLADSRLYNKYYGNQNHFKEGISVFHFNATNRFVRKAASLILTGSLLVSTAAVSLCVSASTSSKSAGSSSDGEISIVKKTADSSISLQPQYYNEDAPVGTTTSGLKVGVISDVHLAVDQNSVGWTNSAYDAQREANLKNALTYYKANGISLLIVVGDVADQAQPGGYQLFNQIFDSIYTDKTTAPQKLFVMGNHDNYGMFGTETSASEQKNFETNLGVDSVNTNMVVGGYHFIGFSTEGPDYAGDFSQTSIKWLDQQLAAAAAEDSTKPIFVAVHQPVNGTLVDSDPCTGALDAVFKKYPQVIEFSGHTHDPLADERSIYQKDYTCVGTGELYYTELPTGVPDNGYMTANSLLVTIGSDKVDIERYDVIHNEKILNDWTVSLPNNDPSTFTYTPDRASKSAAPAFDSTAKLNTDVTINSCDLSFDAAKAEEGSFVYSYVFKVKDSQGNLVSTPKTIPTEFYTGISRMPSVEDYTVTGLKSGQNYTVEVYASNCFGKLSTPLTAAIQTAADDGTVRNVLTVDFADGTCKDTSSFNTANTTVGNPKIAYDSTLKKNVMQFDGNSFIDYTINDLQRAYISSEFTLEAVFKMNTIKQQAVVENLESSGIGFESDPSGKTEIWARINSSYQHDGPTLKTNQYYYETATFDGSKICVYLNGSLYSTIKTTGTVTYNSAIQMCLGGNPDPSGNAGYLFDGDIAYVNILNKPLSADDVLKNYDTMFGIEYTPTTTTTESTTEATTSTTAEVTTTEPATTTESAAPTTTATQTALPTTESTSSVTTISSDTETPTSTAESVETEVPSSTATPVSTATSAGTVAGQTSAPNNGQTNATETAGSTSAATTAAPIANVQTGESNAVSAVLVLSLLSAIASAGCLLATRKAKE